jgi:hypothetical protein
MRSWVKTYPDDPDGHDALHVTLALGHRPRAGLATIACRGRGDLEDLVGVVDVEEQVGETEDRDDGPHLVGLTTVLSLKKYHCMRAETELKRWRESMKVVVVRRKEEKKMVDET